jgi:phosphopantetheine adenylyltransferase
MPQLTQDAVRKSIGDAYAALHAGMPKLLAAAQNRTQQDYLISLRDNLRDAFWAATARELADFNVQVAQFHAQLQAGTKELKKQLQQLQSLAQVIGVITEVVKLAAAVATLAAI